MFWRQQQDLETHPVFSGSVLVLDESCREAFPDSCDELKTGGWYIVNETGLQLQDCTIGAGTDVKAGHRLFFLRLEVACGRAHVRI